MKARVLFMAAALLHALVAAAPQTADDPRIGWHFYEDPPAPAIKPARPAPLPVAPPSPSRKAEPPELKAFAEMQRNMEELRNIAIVRPTDENVRRYMEYEMMVSEKASMFASVAQRVARINPELDSSLQGRPASRFAGEVFDREEAGKRTRRLKALAKDHVLMFFFRSDCPYCHAFAPIIAHIQSEFGIRVEAVSLDGGGLPEYARPRRDNGIAQRLGVRQVPAVFLVQPSAGEIATVSYGLLPRSDLEQRIVLVADGKAAGDISASNVLPTRP